MSTLMHTYGLVSAYLLRMHDRSPIAEVAWNKAIPGEMVESGTLSQSSICRLQAARNRAVVLITNGNHFRPERSRAILAIDEAVSNAVDVDLRDRSSGILTLN